MRPEQHSLGDLAGLVDGTVTGDETIAITAVEHDSRRCAPGSLFVAIRGFTVDGHRFIDQAVLKGASAVCVEEPVSTSVPQIVVAETRSVLGPLAAAVMGHPSSHLDVVGITGTNGKTTVSYLLEAIATAAGKRSGIIGTVGAHIAGEAVPLERTTPEATELQRLLARMVDDQVRIVAMEVSSHALALQRVDGVTFHTVAFTNLTQDHLDFHGDMTEYFDTKAMLFSADRARRAVIWTDDPHGRELAKRTRLPVLRVGRSEGCDVRIVDEDVTVAESRCLLATPDGEARIVMAIGGAFNVENAAIATGCALSLGLPLEAVTNGLGHFAGVPGRFELVSGDADLSVIVDYAHTPDGVRVAVEAARGASEGRVIVVMGAGGERDHAKRPLMGAAASSADLVIVTNDNPRSEDPRSIADQIESGIRGPEVRIELDRRRAIADAIHAGRPGDVVLVLGKGHEQGQDFGDRVIPFDDRVVAREVLEAGR